MKTNGNDKVLESYKIFPYIAWILTFGFVMFVYHIAMELRIVAESLQAQTSFLQEQIKQSPEGVQYQNFEREEQ